MAERGDGHTALRTCDSVSQNSAFPLSVRRAAERVKVYIAARWRLSELGVGRQTSLITSTRLDDRILLAGADAFDPNTPAYEGRWKSTIEQLAKESNRSANPRNVVEHVHLQLDSIESGVRLSGDDLPPDTRQSSSPPVHYLFAQSTEGIAAQLRGWALQQHKLPNLQCGPRLAASIALEEAGLLALRVPAAALNLLEFALRGFKACNDSVGTLLAASARALIMSTFRDAHDELAEVDSAVEQCDREGLVGRAALKMSYIPQLRARNPADGAADFWESWSIRIAAARDHESVPTQMITGATVTPVVLGPDLHAVLSIRRLHATNSTAKQAASPAASAANPTASPAAATAGRAAEPPPLRFSLWPSVRRFFAGAWTFLIAYAFSAWILKLVNGLHFRGADGPPGVFGDGLSSGVVNALLLSVGCLIGLFALFQNNTNLRASRSPLWQVMRGFQGIVFIILGMAILVLAGAYLFRGFDWLLDRANIEISIVWKWIAFFGVIGLLGYIPMIGMGLIRLVERMVKIRFDVLQGDSSDQLYVRLTVRVARLSMF